VASAGERPEVPSGGRMEAPLRGRVWVRSAVGPAGGRRWASGIREVVEGPAFAAPAERGERGASPVVGPAGRVRSDDTPGLEIRGGGVAPGRRAGGRCGSSGDRGADALAGGRPVAGRVGVASPERGAPAAGGGPVRGVRPAALGGRLAEPGLWARPGAVGGVAPRESAGALGGSAAGRTGRLRGGCGPSARRGGSGGRCPGVVGSLSLTR
jgi:hypothetical protein